MTLRIRIEHGQDAGHTWRLAAPGGYLLGRSTQVPIRILDMKVSKGHARIDVFPDGSEPQISDLGSRHGTLLNGQPVQSTKTLKPGDELRLGLTILRILSDGEADVTPHPSSAPGEAETAPASKSARDIIAGTPKKVRREFPADALVGKEIGGYKVLKKIGQGGMGSVYVAEQLSLHREVAFKVLSEKFTSDRTFVDQFVNEAQSAAALNHPNVVQVYDVGRENGRYYFSMEFVSGGSLEERLHEEGKASWQDALNWLIDAANALIFANKRDILHRDVKPDNLMLAEDGSAKLCDLGLAKKAANPDMLAAGIIGTPAFISPEAIRRRRDIDVRSDLYCLGCTFYRVLTGRSPYPGKTVKEILIGHLKKPVPRVSQSVQGLPKELDDVIFKLMQKEPDERYESPSDLLQSLDRIRIQHGLEAHGIRPPSRKPLVIAVAVLVVVLAGALTVILRPREPLKRGPTPEEIQKREAAEAEARAKASEAFQSAAGKALSDLRLTRAKGQLGIDNYTDPSWAQLAGDFEKLAEDLTSNEDYGEEPDILQIAEEARKEAKEIREGVGLRKRLAAGVTHARETKLQELDGKLKDLRKGFDDDLDKGLWLAAMQRVRKDEIDRLLKPYLEIRIEDILPDDVPRADKLKFKGELLLDPKKHVAPKVARYLPGASPGEALWEKARAYGVKHHHDAISRARTLLNTKPPTHEGLEAAEGELREWLDTLPEDAAVGDAEIAKKIADWRKEGRYLERQAQIRNARLYRADQEHDRQALVTLVKALRTPWDGLLFKFRFAAAAQQAEKAAAEMRDPRYRLLAAGLADDARALEALVQRIVAAYPDGWSDAVVTVPDPEGGQGEARVKAVTEQGLDFGDGVRPWARLGMTWLDHRLLFPEGGKPRIALEAADQRGVAALAELAIDYDRATKAYQACLAALPADSDEQAALRERMGRLGLEKQTAGYWQQMIGILRQVESFVNAHHPDTVGEETFWENEELRKDAAGRASEMRRLLQEARAAEAHLRDDVELQTTVWGIAISAKPSVELAYAGEPQVHVPAPLDPPPSMTDDGADGAPGGDGEKKVAPGDDGKTPGADGTKDGEGSGDGADGAPEGKGSQPGNGNQPPGSNEPDAPAPPGG